MNLIERHKHNRKIFNPSDKKDIDEYKHFVMFNKWKNGCPFFLDWPYLSIPDMIKDRITKHALKLL